MVEILFQTQCCLLVTSPDRSYLSGIGAEWIDVGPMGEEDASALAGMTDPRDVWKGIGMLPLPLKQVRQNKIHTYKYTTALFCGSHHQSFCCWVV